MNIAFDSLAINFSRTRGIGKYTYSQILSIIQLEPNNKYYIFDPYNNYELNESFFNVNIEIVHFYFGENAFVIEENTLPVFGDVVKRFIKDYKIDIFYITNPVLTGYKCVYHKDYFLNTKVAITLYDLIPYVMRNHYLNDVHTLDQYMKCLDQYKWADIVLSISNSAKEDLMKITGSDGKNVHVIGGGADSRFKKIEITKDQEEEIRAKYNIKGDFILSTTGDDYRKNIDGLLKAYSLLPKRLIDQYQLILVCSIFEDSIKRYLKVLDKKIAKDRIIFTGFVPDEDLLYLYNMATLMAFPSKYEGFGLPIVEAWACKTPVLTADNSSLKEVAGDCAILVDADSEDSIEKGLELSLTKSNLEQLAQKGYEREQKEYTWEKVAMHSAEAFKSIENADQISAIFDSGKKLKIAMFTPLPPLESGISDYSVDIINELSHYYDIDAIVDDGYTPDVKFSSDNVGIINHREYQKSDYYKTIFQVGNSEFHCYMFDYIRKSKDIIVLHDINLRGVLWWYVGHIAKDEMILRHYLSAEFETDTVDAIMNDKTGATEEFQQENPVNSFLTDYASRIIVHSTYGKEKLLQKNISRIVTVIPHYARVEDLPDKKAAKQDLGISADTFVFSAFGHIHATKRIVPIIKAFSKMHNNKKMILCLVGKPAKEIEQSLQTLIKDNHLEDCIRITGYTDLNTFKKYIDATDVCLNLRFPYNGETSGSLMRTLAKGKCVVINDLGSFSEVPDEACFKLPSPKIMSDEEEINAIEHAMDVLSTNDKLRSFIECQARHYAEAKLDIKIIARQYSDVIKDDSSHLLNENLLNTIGSKLNSIKASEEEVFVLSRTLAYSIGAEELLEKYNSINIQSLLESINLK